MCTHTTFLETGGPSSYWARESLITCQPFPDLPIAVYSVFLLEVLQTALSGADLYYWFASGFGDMNHLAAPYASAFDAPIMGSLVSLCVQFFFVYRILVLGKKESWWLCVLICLVKFPLHLVRQYISQYAQSSIVGATAAFMGGTYVSLLRIYHTRNIYSHAAVTYPREICQRTNPKDPRIGKVTK
jgi:hypothetical protein